MEATVKQDPDPCSEAFEEHHFSNMGSSFKLYCVGSRRFGTLSALSYTGTLNSITVRERGSATHAAKAAIGNKQGTRASTVESQEQAHGILVKFLASPAHNSSPSSLSSDFDQQDPSS
jgi:hypothetical protein